MSEFLGFWKTIPVLWLALCLSGCASSPAQPVVVLEAPSSQGSRFRTLERQRDLWMAPQAVGNDILHHEQTVTYVEKAATWQLPSTLEPHTVSTPELPLEMGEYDAGVTRVQRDIIAGTQRQFEDLSADFEKLKKQSSDQLKAREDHLQAVASDLLQARQEAAQASQKLGRMEAIEKRRKEEEARRLHEKRWYQFWK